MEFQLLEPDYEWLSFCKIECDGYLIETEVTIFRGIRVKIREVDSMVYFVNWYCGQELQWAAPLIFLLLKAISKKEDMRSLPMPEIGPWHNDEGFTAWVLQYMIPAEGEIIFPSSADVDSIREYLEKNSRK